MTRDLAIRFADSYRRRRQPWMAEIWETWARRLP